MRIVMLTGHAPDWRHPWEEAARLVGDVVTIRAHRGARGGVRRVGDGEYEMGIVKVQPEALTAGLTARLMTRRYIDALNRVRSDHGPIDLLHAHFYSAALHVGGLGLPTVVSEHTTVFTRPERSAVVRRSTRAAQRVYDRSALVMPVSSALEADMRRAGIRGTLRVVPNPVDVRAFRLVERSRPDREIRVLFAQRLAPTKGLDALIRALHAARRVEPRLVLHVAGEGSARGEAELLTRSLDLERAVMFYGHLEQAELAHEMRAAHLLAFPSRGDSFGLPVIEALCSGLPVLATPQGIVADVVTEERGVIVPVDDVHAMAQGLVDLGRRSGEVPARVIADGVAAQFSPAAIAAELADVYATVAR